MTIWKVTYAWGLLGLVVVIGLPLAGWQARRTARSGCTLDGTTIDPAYRVEVVEDDGHAYDFCCPRCAVIWLGQQPTPPAAIKVTDETSGALIDASVAWYVRSSIVTVPNTGNRLHAFRDRADAERHAGSFQGAVLPTSENLFHWPPAHDPSGPASP